MPTMASWYTNRHDTKDTRKAHERRMREHGYDDGYAGTAARSLDSTYQLAYRRGLEARRELASDE